MATRGRPKKPTKLHILDGTFRDDRHDGAEPKPAVGLPVRPKHLTKHAKEMWTELVKVLGESGVLTKADRNTMALYCEAYSQWRNAKEEIEKKGAVLDDPDGGRMYRNPYVAIQHEAATRMMSIGGTLGLDPSSRAKMRIAVAAPKDDGPNSKSRFFKNREQA